MKFKDKNQIRQGDILLRDVSITEEEKTGIGYVGTGDKVLAYGETTGHSHVMKGDIEFYDNGNGLVVTSIKGQTKLIHEEHGETEIPREDYIVIRQRELDPVEGIRKVMD